MGDRLGPLTKEVPQLSDSPTTAELKENQESLKEAIMEIRLLLLQWATPMPPAESQGEFVAAAEPKRRQR